MNLGGAWGRDEYVQTHNIWSLKELIRNESKPVRQWELHDCKN